MKQDNLAGLNPARFQSQIGGKPTDLYVLRNAEGMEVCVCNYGALILSILVPDADGRFENVVVGADNLADAIRLADGYYIGATIGPVAG